MSTADLERQRDGHAHVLQKYGEAAANQAENLRGAIITAHTAGWDTAKIADHAGLTITRVQDVIDRDEALKAAIKAD